MVDFIAARFANRVMDQINVIVTKKYTPEAFTSHVRNAIYKIIKQARVDGVDLKGPANFRSLNINSCDNCAHCHIGQTVELAQCMKHDLDVTYALGHICDDHQQEKDNLWLGDENE